MTSYLRKVITVKKMSGVESKNANLGIDTYLVDAFTDKIFLGNPAAVCLMTKYEAKKLNDNDFVMIAAELNQPNTAFVVSENNDFTTGSQFGLRWCTRLKEVDLCGHGTMAASAVLFYTLGNDNEQLEFSTKSGPLYVKKASNRGISMNLPISPPEPMNQEPFSDLLKITVGDVDLVQEVQLDKTGKLLVRLRDEVTREALMKLKPQTEAMVSTYNKGDLHGIGVTLKGSRKNGCVDKDGNVYDFVSRYFCPWDGPLEDQVCGSWHTVICDYWSKELGKQDLYVNQCSPRGGQLWLTVGEDGRVTLSGQAVMRMKGVFFL
ncbi:phenazine biosynthesis-like domain-containing protein [Aplysia californica]|uniref:Phenazine biosynthesis-like domain-containing protein n=1 Tax=Aplysia californica TaxID=6500 RepID=A0ABM0JFJ3_APLCA|nr:phenazine biosynthesis-like domain-containing protein [Aplysia californica]